ncbi:MAG: SRPBCC family protein [Acidimicrobiia bacterium]
MWEGAKGAALELEVSTIIDRPVATAWDFYAVHHVENHPRWDPTLELEATSDGPIGVGTVIKRRASRFGDTTEGTMEVVEFEPEKIMRVRTRDGPMTINGWVLFEPVDDETTRLTLGGEFPGVDDSMEDRIRPMMEQSASTIKALIESET